MGSKWGFYKFPLDPAHDRPEIGETLCWREAETQSVILHAGDMEYLQGNGEKRALGFDLTLPLKPQLEAATRSLIAAQHRLRHAEPNARKSVAALSSRWTLCLRALDAQSQGVSPDAISAIMTPGQPSALEALVAEANALSASGYRYILALPER